MKIYKCVKTCDLCLEHWVNKIHMSAGYVNVSEKDTEWRKFTFEKGGYIKPFMEWPWVKKTEQHNKDNGAAGR